MMEWSWSTFLVEIVNFVLLVWLLTRLLYRPIARAVAERRQAIVQASERAERMVREGEELRKRYEERAQEWEREKSALREHFEREFAEERARREAALVAELRQREERAESALHAREQEQLAHLQRLAAQEAAKFCAKLLARFASADLERCLVEAAIEDLAALSAEERAALARAFDHRREVSVTTRYPLAEPQRAAVLNALRACLGSSANARFTQDDAVLSGMRADLGATVLEADLADELRWFAQRRHADAT